MQPRFLLSVVFGILLGVFGTAIVMHVNTLPASVVENTNDNDSVTTITSANSGSGESTQTQAGYTLAQVKTHATASNCWVAINGKVYDLTNWINQHPGGPDRILAICGTDATAAFNAQHFGQREPAQELVTFYIAPLL